MAVVLAIHDREAGFGSARRLLGGVALEVVVSSLTAPIILLAQTAAILQILSGQDSGWATQRRDADRLTLLQALRLHKAETLLGATLLTLALVFEPAAIPWVAIPAVALVTAFAISAITARPADRLRLLATPERQQPPAVLRRARALMGVEPAVVETLRRPRWLKAPSLPETPIAPGLTV
jgi:membrane glycosyltransferase